MEKIASFLNEVCDSSSGDILDVCKKKTFERFVEGWLTFN